MKRQKKKIVNRKNYILYTGIVLSALIVLVTIFAPFLEPHDPTKMELSQKFIAQMCIRDRSGAGVIRYGIRRFRESETPGSDAVKKGFIVQV